MKKIAYSLIAALALFSAAPATAQEAVAQQPAKTAEPEPLAKGIKILHGPYLQNPTESEISIVWVSDKPSIGWVEIAEDDGLHFYGDVREKVYDTINGIKRTDTRHMVRITGLKPNTAYRYRVFVTEVLEHRGNRVVYGQSNGTVVYERKATYFRTLDPDRQSVRFSVFNDIHGKNDLLEDLSNRCEMNRNDFVVFNGDMVSIFDNEEQMFGGFMDTAVKLFASETPMIYSRGNHETRGKFAPRFQEFFSQSEEHLYFMRSVGPVCMLVLDTGEDKPDSDIEYYGITDYDGYRRAQAEWLKKAIQSDEFKAAKYRIVIAHMPPVGGWYGEEQVRRLFLPILNNAGVDVMFCGHSHKHIHIDPSEANDYPILVNDNNSVLTVEADSKELKVKMISRDGKIADTISVKK